MAAGNIILLSFTLLFLVAAMGLSCWHVYLSVDYLTFQDKSIGDAFVSAVNKIGLVNVILNSISIFGGLVCLIGTVLRKLFMVKWVNSLFFFYYFGYHVAFLVINFIVYGAIIFGLIEIAYVAIGLLGFIFNIFYARSLRRSMQVDRQQRQKMQEVAH